MEWPEDLVGFETAHELVFGCGLDSYQWEDEVPELNGFWPTCGNLLVYFSVQVFNRLNF